MTIFDLLRFPLSQFPEISGVYIQAKISLKRFQNFLQNDDIKGLPSASSAANSTSANKPAPTAAVGSVQMREVSLGWPTSQKSGGESESESDEDEDEEDSNDEERENCMQATVSTVKDLWKSYKDANRKSATTLNAKGRESKMSVQSTSTASEKQKLLSTESQKNQSVSEAPVIKKTQKKKKDESSSEDDEEEDDESSSKEELKGKKKPQQKVGAAKKGGSVPSKKKNEESESSDEDSDDEEEGESESSEEDKKKQPKGKQQTQKKDTPAQKPDKNGSKKQKESSSEEEDDKESEEDEDEEDSEDGFDGVIVLENLNLKVAPRSLNVVVGVTGAGKSTLLQGGLLGECRHICGDTTLTGSVSYVSQSAWIQHATLRDNVLFGLPFEKER